MDSTSSVVFPPKKIVSPHAFKAELEKLGICDFSSQREGSLGPGFSSLTEKLISKFLRKLDGSTLASLGRVSRYFYVYCRDESLWKRLVIARDKGEFVWKGSWRQTFLFVSDASTQLSVTEGIRIPNFFSKKLYSEWYRSNIPMKFFNYIELETIPRLYKPVPSLVRNEFVIPNIPVIISGALDNWPATSNWTVEKLLERFGNIRFKTDDVDAKGKKYRTSFTNFVNYMRTNKDEDPVYLFDPGFYNRVPEMLCDFKVPPYFPDDLFSVLGEEERPDYCWLVIGSERSGSSFHIDPYRTSAWNAVLHGRKRWALYPPDHHPPGVPVRADKDEGIDYDAPDPIKYFLDIYPTISPEKKPLEGIMNPGDLIFVPSGWWHMVLNLEETVAVTQNFVGEGNIEAVAKDLTLPSNKKFKKQFLKSLEKEYPQTAKRMKL